MQRTIHTTLAPTGRGPFPQVLAARSLVFVSGQGPLSSQTNQPNAGAFDDQVRQSFANVAAIPRADRFGLGHIVKVTADLTDLANAPAFNQAYEQLMPARVDRVWHD